jgi:hypothetical protein
LYDSKEALKIDAKLDWKVDVEGAVDMIDRGEEKDSWWWKCDKKGLAISRRPNLRPNAAHSHSKRSERSGRSELAQLPRPVLRTVGL